MSDDHIRDGRLTEESNAAEVLTKDDCLRILEMYKDWDPWAEAAEPVGQASPLGRLYGRRLNLLRAVTEKLHRILDEQEHPLITITMEEQANREAAERAPGWHVGEQLTPEQIPAVDATGREIEPQPEARATQPMDDVPTFR